MDFVLWNTCIHGMKVRREAKSHRIPGICLSLFGFLLLFVGAMMLSMASIQQSFNNDSIKTVGPICLSAGICLVAGGFAHQFIKHRKWKRRHDTSKEPLPARAADYEIKVGDMRIENSLSTNEVILGIEDISEPMPSSSGLQGCVYSSSSRSSSSSSLSELTEITDQPHFVQENRDSESPKVKSVDYGIFCTHSSRSLLPQTGCPNQADYSTNKKSSDARKIKSSLKSSSNQFSQKLPTIMITPPEDDLRELWWPSKYIHIEYTEYVLWWICCSSFDFNDWIGQELCRILFSQVPSTYTYMWQCPYIYV